MEDSSLHLSPSLPDLVEMVRRTVLASEFGVDGPSLDENENG
jgi:hypothetical protein